MKAKKFATQIDETVLEHLKKYASETDKNIGTIVTEALADYLQKVRVRPVFLSAMNDVLDENEELLKRLAK